MMIQKIRNEVASKTGLHTYFLKAIETTTSPYCVVSQTSGSESYTHDGSNKLVESSVDVTVWGSSYPQVKAIAPTIRNLVEYSDDEIVYITKELEIDRIDGQFYGILITFSVRYKEE